MDYRTIEREVDQFREIDGTDHNDFRLFSIQLTECMKWSIKCSKIINWYRDRLPFDVYKGFMESDDLTAYLPIKIGKYIKKDFHDNSEAHINYVRDMFLFKND